jgi:signal transduction histidine kinase
MWIDDIPTWIAALVPARLAVWPLLGGAGATLASAVRDGRRRTVLNEHLHEVRRPLQVLALTPRQMGGSGERDGVPAGDGALELAAAALIRLEREINGERAEGGRVRALVAVRPLLESARRRWRGQAALVGSSVEVRWDAEEAAVEGDRIDLAAALDNLIANALEHGGAEIELGADLIGGRLCLAVVDSGRGAGRRERAREATLSGRATRRRRDPRAPFGRLSGRARHGHGLRLVRRTAARHDGAFALHRGVYGTSAVLELPVALPGGTRSRAAEPARRTPSQTANSPLPGEARRPDAQSRREVS